MAPKEITDETDPQAAHDIWTEATDFTASEMRGLRGDPNHEAYLEVAEGRQTSDPPIPGGPLKDAIHLAETPKSDWGDDEKAEADEALNWRARHEPQFDPMEGEDLVEGDDVFVNKREVAAARWGFDFDNDGWP